MRFNLKIKILLEICVNISYMPTKISSVPNTGKEKKNPRTLFLFIIKNFSKLYTVIPSILVF